ncbi:MAG: methyltransferase domain-containing protein [Deltaproteobacteria bacterium]|nr:MAG: methyltransferase domain-containing protein [Deltaproteobacteria bacterium]
MEAYLHGTSPKEQERLALLNSLINDAGLRELRLRGGERIVDFGAGLGQFSAAMAEAGARVVGIERSEEQLGRAARHERLELRRGDAQDPPLRPEEWGSFDVAHARFLLEHVRDPAAVVRQMVRAVRPSGRVVLQDDDHDVLRCHPEPPGFAALWRAYQRTYDRLGCDPYVGRRLVSLLHGAGASPVRCTFLFFGACAGEEKFPALVENMAGLFLGARDAIVGQQLLDSAEFDAAIAGLRGWAERPDSAFWYAIFWAEGVRR